MEILFLSLLVFAVFGFSEFLHILRLKIIFPKRKMYAHIVINLQKDTAEKQLLYACEQWLWYGKNYADFIVPNVSALDDESYENCKQIAQKYGVKFPEKS